MRLAIVMTFALLQVLSGLCLAAERSRSWEDTNVVLISIDTLRYDHLGCYGYGRNTSPNIDSLAAESAVFDNYIVSAYLTPICQMSLFTSQYPRLNGMVRFDVAEKEVSGRRMPEILKCYDYFNSAFSSSPEFNFNYRFVSGKLAESGRIFSEKFDTFQASKNEREIEDGFLGWVDENKDKKFFLWIAIGSAHWPYGYYAPDHVRRMFDPPNYTPFQVNIPGQKLIDGNYIGYPVLSRIYKGEYYLNFSAAYRLTNKDKQFILSRYDAGIHYVDMYIGRLMEALRKNGLMEKTVIILHSVHGEDLGEHGYFQHYDIYDTEIKNALIIRFPEREFAGMRIKEQVQDVDILPSLLDYLRIPLHHGFQGASFLPLLNGSTGPKR